jgi:GT2 family glycosyltransferase
MTLECLRSLAAQTRTPYQLIVVDNASGDGSADAIRAGFPHAELVESPVNHGFAGANNLAALNAKGEYLLLLNPDTVVLDRAVDRLLDFARARPDAGIWGGRTVFADGRLNPASCWRRMTLWNIFCRTSGLTGLFPNSAVFNGEAYGGWDRMTERAVDIVSGCFFLIRRADWERLGGFDPRFHMYGEEADLCLRAQGLGLRPRITPEACIVHHGGASERARADKMVRLLRSKIALIDQHVPPARRGLARWLFALWPRTRALVHRLRGARAAESARVWSEILDRRDEWDRGLG